MRKTMMVLLAVLTLAAAAKPKAKKAVAETWPDGTVMDAWFQNTQKVDPATLGRRYVLTDYGVLIGSTAIQTEQI